MRRIESRINTRSESYKANRTHNLRVREEFLAMMHDVRHVRPERDVKRLRDQGKLLVRERLDLLLDPGTPFLELSPLAANHAKYDAHIKGAGIVSGIGVVNGREVMVLANDGASRVAQCIPWAPGSRSAPSGSRWRTACQSSTWSTARALTCPCRWISSMRADTCSTANAACRPPAWSRSR